MTSHHTPVADKPVAAISSLITDIVDAVNGYETMVEKAEDELKPKVEKLLALHRENAAQLMEIYSEKGGNPDQAGSMMGIVHTAVANARDITGTLDASALDEIIRGEERILTQYDEAAAETANDGVAHQIIVEQRKALRSEIDRLKK